jgi:hypothetical protein
MPLLGITAVSTLVTALKGTFLQQYTFAIVGAFGLGAVSFIWAYDKFQVLNLQHKHNDDRAGNYVGANQTVDKLIQGRQLAVVAQALSQDMSYDEVQELMDQATYQASAELRNGIDTEKIERGDLP